MLGPDDNITNQIQASGKKNYALSRGGFFAFSISVLGGAGVSYAVFPARRAISRLFFPRGTGASAG